MRVGVTMGGNIIKNINPSYMRVGSGVILEKILYEGGSGG
jgi:hypothetical protein